MVENITTQSVTVKAGSTIALAEQVELPFVDPVLCQLENAKEVTSVSIDDLHVRAKKIAEVVISVEKIRIIT